MNVQIPAEDATRVLLAMATIWPPGPDFRFDVCRALRETIGAEVVQFRRMDIAAGERDWVVYPQSWTERLEEMEPALNRHRHEHPMVAFFTGGEHAPVIRVSDRVDPETWASSGLFREYFEPLGLPWEMIMPVPSDDRFLNLLTFSRADRDFTEREMTLCQAFLPALSLGCGGVPEGEDPRSGVVAGWLGVSIDVDGRILRVLPEDPEGALVPGLSLPVEVRRADGELGLAAAQRLTIAGSEWVARSLMATAEGELVGMRRVAALPATIDLLTPLQRDVLRLVAAGTPDDAVAAEVGVDVRTVREEIDDILAVLGVPTRMAAAVRWRAEKFDAQDGPR